MNNNYYIYTNSVHDFIGCFPSPCEYMSCSIIIQYSVLYHICYQVVSVLQEWFLYSVLYHICRKVVSVLQEWFLYSVLYHICHNVVSVLQEWFLYSVIYHICHIFKGYEDFISVVVLRVTVALSQSLF